MIETNFKNTEIGRIPQEWEVKQLGEIGLFSKGSGISRADSTTGNIPAVRYGELYTIHDNIIKGFGSYISNKVALSAKKLIKGDVVFTCSGETKEDIGKSAAFVDDCVAYAGGDLIILSPNAGYSSEYLGYCTNSKCCKEQKSSRGQGDAVVHISAKEISTILLPLPPLSEQTRIATALSNVDALISELGRLIEKKRAIKQGAMQQLLTGKKRLNGFNEPWAEKKLGEILQYEQPTKYLVSSTEYSDNGVPVLTAGKTFILGYTNEPNGIYNNLPVIIFDDFVTESKYVDFPFKAKSSAMKILTVNTELVLPKFIYYRMQIIQFDHSTHKRYWISEYSKLSIPIPPVQEQKRIVAKIIELNKHLDLLLADI